MFKLNELTVAIFIAITCFFVGDLYGAAQAKKDYEIEKAEINQKAREKYDTLVTETERLEKETGNTIIELQTNHEREQRNAKTTIDKLRDDARRDAFRLSVPIRSCNANPFAPGDRTAPRAESETRAELLPQTAYDLITLAGDADSEVRRTNLCIDQYNEMKALLDKLRNNKVE